MPVRNGEKYVRRALGSLLNQSYRNVEVIVSDNASTDDTETLCREFAARDKRIRYVKQDENRGGVWNFTYVLSLARGDYFMWAACDDWWEPQFIRSMVTALEADPVAGVAFCAIRRLWESGELIDELYFRGNSNPRQMSNFKLALSIAMQSRHYMFIYGLFRSGLLKDLFADVPKGAAPDQVYMCHAALETKFAYVDHILYVKTVSAAAYSVRYPDDNDTLARADRSSMKFFAVPVHACKYLLNQESIPWKRKLCVPLIGVSWGLALMRPACRHFVRVWSDRLVGTRAGKAMQRRLTTFWKGGKNDRS